MTAPGGDIAGRCATCGKDLCGCSDREWLGPSPDDRAAAKPPARQPIPPISQAEAEARGLA